MLKRFFGDLIVKAEIELDVSSTNKEDALIVAKDTDCLLQSYLCINKNSLEIDGTNVRLYLANGTNIEVWNSEWGGFKSF